MERDRILKNIEKIEKNIKHDKKMIKEDPFSMYWHNDLSFNTSLLNRYNKMLNESK